MRDPMLFWSGVSALTLGGALWLTAMRASSDQSARVLEAVTQLIGGIGAGLIGYETAFRATARSFWDLKINTAVGLSLLSFGLFWVIGGIVRAFER